MAAAEPRPIVSARMTVTLKSGARLRERKAWEKRGIMKGARRGDLGALRKGKRRGFLAANGGHPRAGAGVAGRGQDGPDDGRQTSDFRHQTSGKRRSRGMDRCRWNEP